jgi:sugar/nucleoside kinase (ribokinase family)
MTDYDVYGIGNAIVDKEFEVQDSFFTEHGIEKGLMTLVERDQQVFLLDQLMKTYGLKKRAGGGSAANSLYAVSQFGGKAFYSCRVANDETGDFFIDGLGEHNIKTNITNQRVDGLSGRCLVMISPDAERTMQTYLGVSDDISISEMDFEAAKKSKIMYLEGYLVTSDSAKAAIIEMKEYAIANNIKTAMTFSDPAMVEYFCDAVNEVLGDGVDLIFCNQHEAMKWAGVDTLEAACEVLKTKAKQFAITRGSEGSLLFDGENYIDIDPYPIKVVDTNGAGDMFSGAFMYGITNGLDFATSGKLASLASATLVTQFGPRLEPAAHQEILKKIVG